MSSSFTAKQLRATLILPGTNQFFPGTQSNTLVLTGYRMIATLTGSGNFCNQLGLQIFGMSQADMNALTIVWAGANRTEFKNNALVVLESNDGSGWFQVFEGLFVQAAPDYRNLPDVFMSIQAQAGAGQQFSIAQPSSYTGATSAVQIASNLALQMGYTLENNGVTVQLHNPYFHGTLMDQFRELCQAAQIDFYIDANNTIAITPRNKGRQNKTAVALNQYSGLIGYPTIQWGGVHVDCEFNPNIALGCPIDIASDVPGANGTWYPYQATHTLESQNPGGSWFSNLDCGPYPTQTTTA